MLDFVCLFLKTEFSKTRTLRFKHGLLAQGPDFITQSHYMLKLLGSNTLLCKQRMVLHFKC